MTSPKKVEGRIDSDANALTDLSIGAVRHAEQAVKVSPGVYHYRGWRIDHDPPPIPIRTCDWQFAHLDYDLDDPRHGHAASLEAACAEIDNYETDGEF